MNMKAVCVALALALVSLAGCETTDEYTANIARKYPTPEGAKPACVDAAARARKWCRDKDVNTDTLWTNNCIKAQFDYNAACR
jgi:hypothetical protein